MRRLLNASHATLKNQTPFDSRRFYTPTKATADQANLCVIDNFLLITT